MNRSNIEASRPKTTKAHLGSLTHVEHVASGNVKAPDPVPCQSKAPPRAPPGLLTSTWMQECP